MLQSVAGPSSSGRRACRIRSVDENVRWAECAGVILAGPEVMSATGTGFAHGSVEISRNPARITDEASIHRAHEGVGAEAGLPAAP